MTAAPGLRVRLAQALAWWMVVWFFSYLGMFAYIAGWLPFGSSFYVICAALPAGVLLWQDPELRRAFLGHRAVLGFGLYLWLCLAWFLLFPQSPASFTALKNHLTTTLVFACCFTACLVPEGLRALRVAMASSVAVASVLNMVAIFFPFADSGYGFRSAGLYQNPNGCAYALAFGTLLALGVVPEKRRSLFLGLVIPGALLTFSRSGMLVLVLVLAGLAWTGRLKARQILAALAGCVGVLAVLLLLFRQGGAGDIQFRFLNLGFVERISFATYDASGLDRLAIVREGWDYVKQHPWLGGGLGSSVNWPPAEGSHVEYVEMMMDFGGWAVVLYPLLIWAVSPRGRLGAIALLALLGLGFFDHNLLDTLDLPVCFGVLAAWPAVTSAGER